MPKAPGNSFGARRLRQSPGPVVGIRAPSGAWFKPTLALLTALAVCCSGSTARAQLRVATYNTAGGPRASLGTVLAALGTDDVGGVVRPLDVLTLQEQTSLASTTQQIVSLLNGLYGPGTYARGTVEAGTSGGGRPGLIYNTQTIELISEQAFGIVNTSAQARQGMLYRLRPLGYGPEADFYLFSDHMKAGTSSSDQARRLVEAQAIRQLADALGEGAHIIYAGDYNVRSAAESSIQAMLAPGPGQAHDPMQLTDVDGVPIQWYDNGFVRIAHTQSPVDSTLPGTSGLITGGLDDRFDFQLVTAELLDGEGMSYLGPGFGDTLATAPSYRAFGNNGKHPLNAAVNHPSNSAQPPEVLAALATATDHLPVVVDYQLPARLDVSPAVYPDRVLVGAPAQVQFTVSNSAPVALALGADELDYLATGLGSVSGEVQATDWALGAGNLHELPLATELPGQQLGEVLVHSLSQGTSSQPWSLPVDYTVLAHAQGSWSPLVELTSITLDLGNFFQSSDPLQQTLDLFNLDAVPGATAALRLLNLEGLGATSTLHLGLLPSAIDAGNSAPIAIEFDRSAVGNFAATWLIESADEDVPGAMLLAPLQLTLTGLVTVVGDFDFDTDLDAADIDLLRGALGTTEGLFDLDHSGLVDQDDLDLMVEQLLGTRPGDLDLDGRVSAADLAVQLAHLGSITGWAGGNLNGDTLVDANDFALLQAQYGFQNSPGSISVPEPGSWQLAGWGLVLVWYRRRHSSPAYRTKTDPRLWLRTLGRRCI